MAAFPHKKRTITKFMHLDVRSFATAADDHLLHSQISVIYITFNCP